MDNSWLLNLDYNYFNHYCDFITLESLQSESLQGYTSSVICSKYIINLLSSFLYIKLSNISFFSKESLKGILIPFGDIPP